MQLSSTLNRKIWLVTGGAGFIGSHFVNLLALKTQDTIVVIDKLTYASQIDAIHSLITRNRIRFVQEDICNRTRIGDLVEQIKPDIIIHFAAETHVDHSISMPHQFVETNIMGTLSLLEAIREEWERNSAKRFIHVSTDEVYGSLDSDTERFTEASLYKPNSPYSASKAASDHLVRAWSQTYKLSTIITHCSNNYGPWQFTDKLIPKVIDCALNKRDIPVYGTGMQIRDWIHVVDHCHALYEISLFGAPGEVYNISSEEEWTNIELVKMICRRIDEEMNYSQGTSETLIRFVTDRRAHDRRYGISNAKLKKELNWFPKYQLDTSLGSVVKWYINRLGVMLDAS